MKRSKVIDAILGSTLYDTVIKNVKLVNIITGEVYNSEIGIIDGKIGHVNQPNEAPLSGNKEYDAEGKYAIPGLIDTHVHTESSMMTVANMAEAIVVHGTTTIACDPHEIGNVLGMEGVKYIYESSEDIPLMVNVLVPSCIPSALGVETAGAEFGKEEIEKLMKMDRVAGLGEVMDFPGVINQSSRMMEIIETAKNYTKFLQGHAPSLVGRELSAYLSTGISSCHETSFSEEARYKLRAGMTLECRESSIVHDIKALAPVLKEFNYPVTTTFCTDDREPDDILKEGHLDHVIRVAIKEGIPPIEAVKMATYNASKLLNKDDIGLIAPGRYANIVLLDRLEEFVVNEVFYKGELVAKEGKMVKPVPNKNYPLENRNTVIFQEKPTKEDFRIASDKDEATMNIIAFNKEVPIITDLEQITLNTNNGYVDISDREDLAVLSVFERHGKKGKKSTCLVKDLGLTHGAIASTVSHDTHNLAVVGKNEDDMMKAVDTLCEVGGGIVCVVDGEIEALIELPIAGLMSDKKIDELAPKTALLKAKISELGLKATCPIIQVASFSLPVIPNVRLTDLGLVDVNKQEIIPIIIS
ncbi:adenine deaminase [Vallitalea guaymasensis]|uniref:adenine deaminase n=1 Tax=Vallitalea guaymasensis TaxID=1185412 RepID=UPI00187D3A19|nr:adenine deaminase [Vallitalea guaymasensis]